VEHIPNKGKNIKVIFLDASTKKTNILEKESTWLIKVAHIAMNDWKVINKGIDCWLTKKRYDRTDMRHQLPIEELNYAKKLSKKFPEYIFALDLALISVRRREYDFLRQKKLIGLAKETTLRTDTDDLFNVFLCAQSRKLKKSAPWYYFPIYKIKPSTVIGNTTVVKMFDNTPAFRTDFVNIEISDVMDILFFYSCNPIVPGYPFPFWLVHEGSQISDSELIQKTVDELEKTTQHTEDKELLKSYRIQMSWMKSFRRL
jgi:hypothetical protein